MSTAVVRTKVLKEETDLCGRHRTHTTIHVSGSSKIQILMIFIESRAN